MLALRTHLISRRSQRQHLSRRPQSLIPAALSVHVPRQFAALSSHCHFCASEGELRSTPVPMSAIAKKRCRVMIGPPEKGAGRSDPNLSTGLNPAGLACWPMPATRQRRLVAPPITSFSCLRYHQHSFKIEAEILDLHRMIGIILKVEWFSNGSE